MAETSQLLTAAKKGRPDEVRRLLAAGAPLYGVEEKWGYGALHFAAGHGHVDICTVLIECNIDVNVGSRDNETPLHMAAQEGQEPAIRYLVDARANLNATNDDGETPLHIAVQSVRGMGVVATLLQLGADSSIQDSDGNTALSLARTYHRGPEIEDVFRSWDPNYQDSDINRENEYDTESLSGDKILAHRAARDLDKLKRRARAIERNPGDKVLAHRAARYLDKLKRRARAIERWLGFQQ